MRSRLFDLFPAVFGLDGDPPEHGLGELGPHRTSVLRAAEAPSSPVMELDLAAGPDGGPGAEAPEDPGPDPSPAEEPPPEPAPAEPPAPQPPPAAAPWDDPPTISFSRILEERPDVLRGYYEAFHAHNDPNSTAWAKRVGETTPEAYARYWYNAHGKYEGYNQGPTTAADNVSLERILQDRPDVLRAFYEGYYGAGNDRNSDAWIKRVGGDTPEAYARYWYEKYGKWEGYAQSDKAAAENIDVERLLIDRPDVFRAFYTEYYGPNNDRKSTAWVDRVGGDTVQDYAKYWYETYGRWEGYTQRSAPEAAPPESDPPAAPPGSGPPPPAEEPPPERPRVEDPSLDPWNHPAIYPDWRPPYPGWEPPGAAGSSPAVEDLLPADAADILGVGQSFGDPGVFG